MKNLTLQEVKDGTFFTFGGVRFKKIGTSKDDEQFAHCKIANQEAYVNILMLAWVEVR